MKQKMSTADVAGEVACLRQRIIGMKLVNIYDVNQKV
jgi:predicted ribosome quality control (RQC) complex YloA/Tae2 family protein